MYCYYGSVGFFNLTLWRQDTFLHGPVFEIIAIRNQYRMVASKNIMEWILYANSYKYIIECADRDCAFLQSWASAWESTHL